MSATVNSGIFTILDFFTQEECLRFVSEFEAAGYESATIQTRKGPVRDAGIRNNERLILEDASLARDLWVRLRGHVPLFLNGRRAIGVNERFRFYRYDPGQYFAPHTDGSFRRENGEESRLTLLIYLNDDFQGGETVFEDTIVSQALGMALVFRHELLHEGRVVTSGTKYVLRSDVMFNPVGRIRG